MIIPKLNLPFIKLLKVNLFSSSQTLSKHACLLKPYSLYWGNKLNKSQVKNSSYLGCFTHSRFQWFIFITDRQRNLSGKDPDFNKVLNWNRKIDFIWGAFFVFTSCEHPSTVSTCSTFTCGINSVRLKQRNNLLLTFSYFKGHKVRICTQLPVY